MWWFLTCFISLCAGQKSIVRHNDTIVKARSCSKACASLNHIRSLYYLDTESPSRSLMERLTRDNDRNAIITTGVTSDFLEMRSLDPSDTGLADITECLCTSQCCYPFIALCYVCNYFFFCTKSSS